MNEPAMTLSREIDLIIERVGRLSRPRQGVYFACCAERLLPAYEAFSSTSGWGRPEILRQALDHFWDQRPREPKDVADWLAKTEEQTPHADDFDNLLATFAQDCCICVDAAVRSLDPGEELSAEWAQYPWEAVKVAVSESVMGAMDLGAGPEADAWDREILKDDRVRAERAFHESLLAKLEGAQSAPIQELRASAQKNAWSSAALLNASPPGHS